MINFRLYPYSLTAPRNNCKITRLAACLSHPNFLLALTSLGLDFCDYLGKHGSCAEQTYDVQLLDPASSSHYLTHHQYTHHYHDDQIVN